MKRVLLSALVCLGMMMVFLGSHRLNAAPDSRQTAIAQPHPMPQSLAQWDEKAAPGDYFDQVRPVPVGALIWSRLPIKVYIEPLPPATLLKPEIWQQTMNRAIQDWQPYLPLTLTSDPAMADIQLSANAPRSKSGARARSAETRYALYVSDRNILSHRVTISIRPSQTQTYLAAAARHELGHALGIWGHSQDPQDVMYFAQVKSPPPISARDVNTLKRLYQQPTQLGWPVK